MAENRVLVTGGAGFIGSHLADRLLQLGYSVAVVDDLSSGQRRHLSQGVRFYNADICSSELARVFEQERPHYVNHYAAQMSVPASVKDPIHDAQVNIIGSLNVLENARKHRVKKVVFASTGGALYGEPEYLPCDESHPVHPLSPYGASKYAIENYLYLYHQVYGLTYTALRYSNVYGPRQNPYGEAGVVAIFARAMIKCQRPTINGSGEQERDFLYVSDAVEACITAMTASAPGVYNVATGTSISVNRIFDLLKSIIDFKESPKYGPPKPGEVFRIYLGCARARRELGWSYEVSLEQGIFETVDYFRSLAQA